MTRRDVRALVWASLYVGAWLILMPWPAAPEPAHDPLFAALYRANHEVYDITYRPPGGPLYECTERTP